MVEQEIKVFDLHNESYTDVFEKSLVILGKILEIEEEKISNVGI